MPMRLRTGQPEIGSCPRFEFCAIGFARLALRLALGFFLILLLARISAEAQQEGMTLAPIAVEVAVVHVDPVTQVVLRLSGPSRFTPTLTEKAFQIRLAGRSVAPPYSERSYEDPLVAAVRLAADGVSIDFRQPGLAARAYPLSGPDRIVVEVSRPVSAFPIPAATPAAAAPSGLTIVVDPGHGGSEMGATGPGGLQEKEITLQIARRLAVTIPGVVPSRVILTRESDSPVSLDDRTSVANHERADLFLSLHANSSRAPGAHGTETYYLSLEASDKLAQEVASRENAANGAPAAGPDSSSENPDLNFILWDLAQSAHLKESSELAEAIQEEMNKISRTENRGIKQAPFRVLVGATMPAVLVEMAFISNPDEEKKLRSPAFQQGVADAIARAIGSFVARRRPGAAPGAPVVTPTPSP
jgi:N-acetylmuramoyl-L-alanine amidase